MPVSRHFQAQGYLRAAYAASFRGPCHRCNLLDYNGRVCERLGSNALFVDKHGQHGAYVMNVCILAEPGDSRSKVFRDELEHQCAKLDVPVVIDETTPLKQPSKDKLLVVLLDPGRAVASHDAELRPFLDAGGTILPVAPDAAVAGAAVKSSCLERTNAFLQERFGSGDEWAVALVDEVLAHLWIQRRRRRVFVSYKRSDSAGVARQIFKHLSGLGYEVFLDETSVPPADDFQNRLEWWLNDADLVVLLASPNLDSSKWVLEEITFAQNHGIGILAVVWPPESPGPALSPRPAILGALMADQQLPLELQSFEDQTPQGTVGEACALEADALSTVIARATRQRTIALRDRLVDLVAYTRQHLADIGITQPAQSGPGDFRFEMNGEPYLLRVVPFRPDTRVYYELAGAADSATVVGCLYTESSVTESETRALAWCLEGNRRAPGNGGNSARIELKLWAQPGGPLP